MAKKERKGANINDILKKKPEILTPSKPKETKTPEKVATVVVDEKKQKTEKGKKPTKKVYTHSTKQETSLFKFIDATNIPEKQKLLQYTRWIALPKKLREPETQTAFAEKCGISRETLSNWKLLTGFWDEVDHYTDKYLRSHAADLYYALIVNAKKTGDPRAIKLYAQKVQGWSEKVRVHDETPETELDAELKQQIAHAIHNIGLATIKKKYDNDNDEDEE